MGDVTASYSIDITLIKVATTADPFLRLPMWLAPILQHFFDLLD